MDNTTKYQVHTCDGTNQNGIDIVFSDLDDESGEQQWWLNIYREATEKELEDGEADEIGEILFFSSITISFCPFCGKELINLKDQQGHQKTKAIKTISYRS